MVAALGLNPKEGMSPVAIRDLFSALDDAPSSTAEPVSVLIVGGAAISLQWNAARVTNDVDVISDHLPAEVRQAAARVAVDHEGVGPNWLNDAAIVARPTGPVPEEPTLIYQGRNLLVSGAGPRYVLAMKLFSGRWADRRDLHLLFDAANIESRDELDRLVTQAYPGVPIHTAARLLIDETWEAYITTRSQHPG